MSLLPTHMLVFHMCAWCPQIDEGNRSPINSVGDGCGCYELNSDCLQLQQVILIT